MQRKTQQQNFLLLNTKESRDSYTFHPSSLIHIIWRTTTVTLIIMILFKTFFPLCHRQILIVQMIRNQAVSNDNYKLQHSVCRQDEQNEPINNTHSNLGISIPLEAPQSRSCFSEVLVLMFQKPQSNKKIRIQHARPILTKDETNKKKMKQNKTKPHEIKINTLCA